MDVLLTILGTAVIVLGLMDLFHTLLHPTGQGRLSQALLSAVWRASKATGHRLGSIAGPAAMVAVILMWVALQAVGWALVYLPHVPGGFMYSSGVDPADYPDAAEALYISLTTLSTLGYGDMVATAPWIRLASPLEALTGFALLTAALTWFTQIYPPLSRRRSLALELKGLADVGYGDAIREAEPAIATRVLDTLAAEVGKVRIDFAQHSEGFYFQEQHPDLSLARQLPYGLQLIDEARGHHDAAVRSSAQRLSVALEQLAAELERGFVAAGEGPGAVFAAYARDHGQTPTGD